jgi:hypothetical protein
VKKFVEPPTRPPLLDEGVRSLPLRFVPQLRGFTLARFGLHTYHGGSQSRLHAHRLSALTKCGVLRNSLRKTHILYGCRLFKCFAPGAVYCFPGASPNRLGYIHFSLARAPRSGERKVHPRPLLYKMTVVVQRNKTSDVGCGVQHFQSLQENSKKCRLSQWCTPHPSIFLYTKP